MRTALFVANVSQNDGGSESSTSSPSYLWYGQAWKGLAPLSGSYHSEPTLGTCRDDKVCCPTPTERCCYRKGHERSESHSVSSLWSAIQAEVLDKLSTWQIIWANFELLRVSYQAETKSKSATISKNVKPLRHKDLNKPYKQRIELITDLSALTSIWGSRDGQKNCATWVYGWLGCHLNMD